jgi:RNA recognition motif-containing protein
LKDLFKQAGNVQYVDVPKNKATHISRGFGIVRFETPEETQTAIEMFNKFDFNGRQLSVRLDQQVPLHHRSSNNSNGNQRTPFRSNNRNQTQDQDHSGDAQYKLFVGNLPWSVNWQDLKDFVKDNGTNPTRANVAFGFDGQSRGWGTLCFATAEEAQDAEAALNGLEFNGREIEVREDRKPTRSY